MSPAPKFSTEDIAKSAQQKKDERIEQERQAEQARDAERIERDRGTAPHITGSEPMQTSSVPNTAATNPILPPGPAMPPADATPVRTPRPGSSEPDAATVRTETHAQRVADAATARAASVGSASSERIADAATAAGTARPGASTSAERLNTDRQLAEDSAAPLFATDAAMSFQQRWDTIQAAFVDDPRRAVEDADALVAETMQRLAETFAQERRRLEQELARRPDADAAPVSQSSNSTEDLRIALRHYRSFFKRLLAV